ncbi:Uroporphyrinogen-III synthase [Mycena indigotica]|uniref:Uroporphyrinogen-III synthase n=1 Tax=Mycena indigotica TaxID=2126181 RepID=A0A8H6TAJ2_9AGAR|nr:Uroporphyrinogen-III synthase [Mycena indigotica]KAF7312340.1 Uroporphyrinogen-III synthase [Mycena indigotica]
MVSDNILFLRTPDSPDRYETTFSSTGYTTASVSVLETAFVNGESLTQLMRRGSEHSGVIITSGRGCDAWDNAIRELQTAFSDLNDLHWRTIPFYVVGKSSASKLIHTRSSYPDSPFAPLDIRGESTGNSEQLAQFITADFSSPPSTPLLYLTGDKNRDTLQEFLHAKGFQLSSFQVYQTQGSSTFAQDLKLVVEKLSNGNIWWIVFFAPSAAAFVVPFLREHFELPSRTARVAAIGPTTFNFLQQELGIKVDAVARKPTPDSLLAAISDASPIDS